MDISINETVITIESDKDETLLSILRSQNYTSVKCGCSRGMCGACTVLIDDKPVPSCLVPIGSIIKQRIITLEQFALSSDYIDIMKGLKNAHVALCGFCDAGKIFAIHEIISSIESPTRNDILKRMRTFDCSCTNIDALIDAVYKAYDVRVERKGKSEYGRK